MVLRHNVGPTVSMIIVLAVAAMTSCGDTRVNVLVPDGFPSFAIMDFTDPLPLDPLPDGWYHRRFWRHGPMEIAFETKEGIPAIRLGTHDTASMLFRHVEIELNAYPILSWQWYIEKGIDGSVDELTRDGDDHPARFFVMFETAGGEATARRSSGATVRSVRGSTSTWGRSHSTWRMVASPMSGAGIERWSISRNSMKSREVILRVPGWWISRSSATRMQPVARLSPTLPMSG